MNIDKCALYIIETLRDAGYQAYLVGGCIRDYILGKDPKDWDICTDALPNTVYKLFGDLGYAVVDTGIKYGTVSVLMNEFDVAIITGDDSKKYSLDEDIGIYEITTFRKLSGPRHPNYVEFTSSLEEDLARRDFTMNALAYSPEEGFIDLFNGVRDIKHETIRCVGNPSNILSEDPLRIVRAIRFQAQLGFDIDTNTNEAIQLLASQGFISMLSRERIQSELFKLISGDYATKVLYEHRDIICTIIPELKATVGFDQRNPNHRYTVYDHMVETVGNLIKQGINDSNLRIAALLHDIGKPIVASEKPDGSGLRFHGHAAASAVMSEKILRRLNCPNDTIKDIFNLIKYHDSRSENKSALKRLTNKLGIEDTSRLIELIHADVLAQSSYNIGDKMAQLRQMRVWLSEVIENHEEFKLSDLEIDGKDLINIGYTPGVTFGLILNNLLAQVLDGKIANTHDILVDYVVEHFPIK